MLSHKMDFSCCANKDAYDFRNPVTFTFRTYFDMHLLWVFRFLMLMFTKIVILFIAIAISHDKVLNYHQVTERELDQLEST